RGARRGRGGERRRAGAEAPQPWAEAGARSGSPGIGPPERRGHAVVLACMLLDLVRLRAGEAAGGDGCVEPVPEGAVERGLELVGTHVETVGHVVQERVAAGTGAATALAHGVRAPGAGE